MEQVSILIVIMVIVAGVLLALWGVVRSFYD